MKRLLLLRHAKSSWKDQARTDHDRPLNPRGQRDAPRMAQLIAGRSERPDRILSSTAARAAQTADAVAEALGEGMVVHRDARLYLASPGDVLTVVRDRGTGARSVLVVGHNPGLEELVARLTGVSEPMPTAALADIRLPIRCWSAMALEETGRLDGVWRPRELQ